MTNYFVTGYSVGGEFARTTVTVAPKDAAERGRAYDALLYSDAAQDGGMLVFAVEAEDESSALAKGRGQYARRNEQQRDRDLSLYKHLETTSAMMAALFSVEAEASQLRGFGETEADAMRNAVESGRVDWDTEEGATWREITQDAKNAGILTFVKTPYGVLVLDKN